MFHREIPTEIVVSLARQLHRVRQVRPHIKITNRVDQYYAHNCTYDNWIRYQAQSILTAESIDYIPPTEQARCRGRANCGARARTRTRHRCAARAGTRPRSDRTRPRYHRVGYGSASGMNQYHMLAIDICVRGLRDADDIWMRCVKMVPFVPFDGVTLELWHDDSEHEEATHKITLENTFYSFQHSMFIEEQADEELLEDARAGLLTSARRDDIIKWYQSFGFTRMFYPSVQVTKQT